MNTHVPCLSPTSVNNPMFIWLCDCHLAANRKGLVFSDCHLTADKVKSDFWSIFSCIYSWIVFFFKCSFWALVDTPCFRCLIGPFLSPSFMIGPFLDFWNFLEVVCTWLLFFWVSGRVPLTHFLSHVFSVICASCHMSFVAVIVYYVIITCFLLIVRCLFIGVTWGDCPLVTVLYFLLSWQLVDSQFQLVVAFLRCSCPVCFLHFNWLLLQGWFYVQEFLLRQNLPATRPQVVHHWVRWQAIHAQVDVETEFGVISPILLVYEF